MKLYERLPDSVTVDGRRYRLDLDFRNVLRMLDELARDDLIPEAREYRALKCVLKHPPRRVGPVLAAVRELLFPPIEGNRHHDRRVTDYEQDADLIRAAFRQNYNIDLYRDRLHWMEFTCLIGALPEGSRYSDIVGIRARPMPKATKYNADERKWLSEAKARYALKIGEKEARDNYDRGVLDVFHALMGMAEKGSD
jgi:hypothetical protein